MPNLLHSKNGVFPSIIDGLGMGIGFTLSITFLASVRELFGNGTVFGFQILPEGIEPIRIIAQPPGGFLTLGLLALLVTFFSNYIGKFAVKRNRKESGE